MDLAEKKKRKQNRDATLILIIPVAIFAKIIYHLFLPDKYFFDSWRMESMLTGSGNMAAWGGYQNAVDFHKSINILNLDTHTEFSIWYGVVMTIIVLIIVSRVKEMNNAQVFYTLMVVGVLNIYVFILNKEMVQILYFLAIYIVISLPIHNTLKILGCAGVFYLESLNFRAYYIIMAALTIGTFIIFSWLSRQKIKKSHIIMTVMALFVMVFVFFYASSFISPKDYKEALNQRDGTTSTIDNGSEDGQGATSAIRNPITVGNNIGIFMVDYVINSVRMMFPIELIFKSPGYSPFFIYQIFILMYTYKTLKNINKLDKKMVVALSCFMAYFLGSAVFEPDFGSWVRHEATTFPVFQLLAYNNENYEEEIVYEAKTV